MKILSTLISIFAWIFTSCSTTGVQASSRLRKMKPNSYYSCQMEIDLLDALDKNNFQKADEAITHGAKVNAIGNQEMTPLAWTLGKQNLLAYSYLLEKGANPNFKTKKVTWNNDGQSVMQFAAMCENPEYISLALRHGGNPNAPDSLSDQTILFASIEHRRSNNIRILAKFGADLDHSAKDGSTPLMLCVYQNDFDLALLLLELGADPSIKNPEGNHIGEIVSMFGDRGIKVLGKERKQKAYYEDFVNKMKMRGLMK